MYIFFRLEKALPLEGPLARNNILDAGDRILDGKITGPESIASRGPEEIFVGVQGGKIIRIWGPRFNHYKVVTSIGPGCGKNLFGSLILSFQMQFSIWCLIVDNPVNGKLL